MLRPTIVFDDEEYDIRIDGDSIWANPFTTNEDELQTFKAKSIEHAVELYSVWLRNRPNLLKRLPELQGKRLYCGCGNRNSCHGNALANLIGKTPGPRPLRDKENRPYITVHTDGACNHVDDYVGGWGFTASYMKPCGKEHRKEKSGAAYDTTSQRMELQAVIESIKFVKRPSNIKIFTDSLYIVKAFRRYQKNRTFPEGYRWVDGWRKNGWTTREGEPVKNQDLWKELLYLCEECGHYVNFQWVKGHHRNKYNKVADKLAVDAKNSLIMDFTKSV